jgi:membrane-associated phospholipid phosphatase
MTTVREHITETRPAAISTPVIRPWSAYASCILLAVLAGLSLLIDLPVARLATEWRHRQPIGALREILAQFEPFAHAAGVAAILLTILVLDRSRRRCMWRLATCAFGVGLAADVVKLSIARARPVRALEEGGADVWATFHGWLACLREGHLVLDRTLQSFPSGHAATAAGLAVGLCWLYPRGRWLFLLFALLAGLQRIFAAAHFPSDVCAGAALGCLIGAVCTDARLLGRLFDRFEGAARAVRL